MLDAINSLVIIVNIGKLFTLIKLLLIF